MKITLRLSSKVNHNGLSEILLSTKIRLDEKVTTLRAKSEIYISPAFFSADKGVDLSKKRVITPKTRKLHNEAKEKLDGLLSAIAKAEENISNSDLNTAWLKDVVEHYLHPEKFSPKISENKTVFDYAKEYITGKGFDKDYIKRFYVLIRTISRYEGFIRATDRNRSNYVFDIDKLTKYDLQDFRDYLKSEEHLSKQYKTLFQKLLTEYPIGIKAGNKKIEVRGENYVINQLKKLKAFLNWLYENGKITNRPFDGFKIGTQKYGTPFI